MRSYAFPAIIERGKAVYGAFFPDLPGCGTAAESLAELADMAREALTLHLEGMIEDGDAVPDATPLENLPHDPEVRELGAMLITVTPGASNQVVLMLPDEVVRRADAQAVSFGKTRERILTDRLETLFAAE